MVVTSTNLKTNLGKYLSAAYTEDIIITRNGRKVAKLVKTDDIFEEFRSMYGVLADTKLSAMSDDEIKQVIHEERGKRYDCTG